MQQVRGDFRQPFDFVTLARHASSYFLHPDRFRGQPIFGVMGALARFNGPSNLLTELCSFLRHFRQHCTFQDAE
jgi:hypothetical protein